MGRRTRMDRETEFKWKAEMMRMLILRTFFPDTIKAEILPETLKTEMTMSPEIIGLLKKAGISPELISGAAGVKSRESIPGATGTYSDFEEGLRVTKFQDAPHELKKRIKLKKLYFEDIDTILERVVHSLARGRNLIFYGPPGTGKTTIAKEICDAYNVEYFMTTGTSDWTTFETIGGYMLEEEGILRFHPGMFLKCYQLYGKPVNHWLIIDEINRADIDKAFGPMFSAFTGDNITLPQMRDGEYIEIKGKPADDDKVVPHRYFIHPDWRIMGTLNTADKSSLYDMSYAFMRRFSFIPINNPLDLDKAVEGLVNIWKIDPDSKTKEQIATAWKLINNIREIGPAIIQDLFDYLMDTGDFTSAIIMHVLPQFEGLDEESLLKFLNQMVKEFPDTINASVLKNEIREFFYIERTADWA